MTQENLNSDYTVKNGTENSFNKNISEMNDVIDFTSVCGEEVVAQTATVDQQVVNDLFNGFLANPSSVMVKFKNNQGYLRIIVKMVHSERFHRTYETYGDAKLVEAIIGEMRGSNSHPLQNYRAEEHELKASDADCRIDIFRQFINSPIRCFFDNDFVAGNGDRYVCASFNIASMRKIKFCLKRSEVETIINEAMKAA